MIKIMNGRSLSSSLPESRQSLPSCRMPVGAMRNQSGSFGTSWASTHFPHKTTCCILVGFLVSEAESVIDENNMNANQHYQGKNSGGVWGEVR